MTPTEFSELLEGVTATPIVEIDKKWQNFWGGYFPTKLWQGLTNGQCRPTASYASCPLPESVVLMVPYVAVSKGWKVSHPEQDRRKKEEKGRQEWGRRCFLNKKSRIFNQIILFLLYNPFIYKYYIMHKYILFIKKYRKHINTIKTKILTLSILRRHT